MRTVDVGVPTNYNHKVDDEKKCAHYNPSIHHANPNTTSQ
jgi:hypothetical protein